MPACCALLGSGPPPCPPACLLPPACRPCQQVGAEHWCALHIACLLSAGLHPSPAHAPAQELIWPQCRRLLRAAVNKSLSIDLKDEGVTSVLLHPGWAGRRACMHMHAPPASCANKGRRWRAMRLADLLFVRPASPARYVRTAMVGFQGLISTETCVKGGRRCCAAAGAGWLPLPAPCCRCCCAAADAADAAVPPRPAACKAACLPPQAADCRRLPPAAWRRLQACWGCWRASGS